MRKYPGNVKKIGGAHLQCVNNHYTKFGHKGMKTFGVTSGHPSYKTLGHVYSSCVLSAMLHASETWPLTKTNLQRLQRNDRAMIR